MSKNIFPSNEPVKQRDGPRSAFHGLHWWQFDLSGYVIWTLERMSLVRDVYRVSPAMRARYSAKKMEVESDIAAPVDTNMPENMLVKWGSAITGRE